VPHGATTLGQIEQARARGPAVFARWEAMTRCPAGKWEGSPPVRARVYDPVRKAALRLRDDPDPRVRLLALHREDDARMLFAFEARCELHLEREETREERQGDRARKRRR